MPTRYRKLHSSEQMIARRIGLQDSEYSRYRDAILREALACARRGQPTTLETILGYCIYKRKDVEKVKKVYKVLERRCKLN